MERSDTSNSRVIGEAPYKDVQKKNEQASSSALPGTERPPSVHRQISEQYSERETIIIPAYSRYTSVPGRVPSSHPLELTWQFFYRFISMPGRVL